MPRDPKHDLARPEISIVVPVYNEQASIPSLLDELLPILDGLQTSYDVVLVDDGSSDDTLPVLLAARQEFAAVRVVQLTRNFGKDAALSAGLMYASGDAVITMDGDLQHPSALIPQLIAKWREGNDVVIPVRANRRGERWFRRLAARLFYHLIRSVSAIDIVPNAGDFRLLDRRVVAVINQMPERCRFMKGIFAWPGFKQARVSFEARPRKHQKSRWSLWRLWNLALDGIFSFSDAPLRVWSYLGSLVAGLSFIYLLIELVKTAVIGIDVPGYPSLLALILIFNGLLMLSIGVQGEYIARIFNEVKGRPIFVVDRAWGFPVQASDSKAEKASAIRSDRPDFVGE